MVKSRPVLVLFLLFLVSVTTRGQNSNDTSHVRPPTVLVYGFKPFAQYKVNISEIIVKKLMQDNSVQGIVFPVKFDRDQFLDPVVKIHPNIIIGIGMTTDSGNHLIAETTAHNLMKTQLFGSVPVIRGGPSTFDSNLPVASNPYLHFSSDAGVGVCNFSMYTILEYINHLDQPKIQFFFIHIPNDMNPEVASGLVKAQIEEILSRFSTKVSN